MPRPAKSTAIETRAARARLKSRREPYWYTIRAGLALGARKPEAGPCTWIKRTRQGAVYSFDAFAVADDFASADGRAILSFADAQAHVLKPHTKRAGNTVDDAMLAYIAALEADGRERAAYDAEKLNAAHVRPTLGAIKLSALTADDLRAWAIHLARRPARLRTKPGADQKHRAAVRSPEAKRKRQNTVNRIANTLLAALNAAFARGDVDSDQAWRRFKKFRGADQARVRYLSHAEVAELDAVLDADFRLMFQAALHTGGRFGQLTDAVVSDFDATAATLRLTSYKGHGGARSYFVHLTDKGRAFFAALCRGRNNPNAPILLRADGEPWGKSEQGRRMEDACARAGITPAASFHILRHTFASHAVMNGTPLIVVARNLGHTTSRMVEKYYGHLAPSYQAEAIRKGAPDFQFAAL